MIINQPLILSGYRHQTSDCHFIHLSGNTLAILMLIIHYGCIDFAFQLSIDRNQILSLHELSFIDRKENVILLGPAGVGKSHMAISLAMAAAEKGKCIYFNTSSDLVLWKLKNKVV
jgi:hypothetical protein